MTGKEQVIELIDQMLSWCDEKSLMVIYCFVIHFVKNMREEVQG